MCSWVPVPEPAVLGGPKEGPERQGAHAGGSLRTRRLRWGCQAHLSTPTVGRSLTFSCQESTRVLQQPRMRKAQATVTVLVIEG